MVALAAALAVASAPVPATLQEASFIAGHWLSERGPVRSEETWNAAAGDAMLGMWRLVQDGRTRLLEILSIRAESGTLVLRLRHFDGALVGREERDRPLVLPLARKAERSLRFEGERVDGGAGRIALTYVRQGDALEVTLEKDGKAQPFGFDPVTRPP